jgi:hypothetical protein
MHPRQVLRTGNSGRSPKISLKTSGALFIVFPWLVTLYYFASLVGTKDAALKGAADPSYRERIETLSPALHCDDPHESRTNENRRDRFQRIRRDDPNIPYRHDGFAERERRVFRADSLRSSIRAPVNVRSPQQRTSRSFDAASQPTSRVWIIMADNRAPSIHDHITNATYPILSAVVNLLYARRHGYNFTYFVYEWNHTAADLAHLHPPAPPAACYHYGTGLFRHGTWCKILACWHSLRSVGRLSWSPFAAYRNESANAIPWFVYLDSDVVVRDHDMSFAEWVSKSPPSISGPSIRDALISFANDRPYPTSNDANAGTFFFHPDAPGSIATAAFFRHWWEAPDGGKAMARFHEQDSLRSFYRTPEWTPKIGVLNNEIWMHRDLAGQWLRHFTDVHEPDRPAVFQRELGALGVTPDAFRGLIQDLIKGHVVSIDVLDAAKQILTSQ